MKTKSNPSSDPGLFYSLFTNCRIGQIVFDEQLGIRFINPRMFELFDTQFEETGEMVFGRIFHCSSLGISCRKCGPDGTERCDLLHAMKVIQKGGVIDNSTVHYSFSRNGQTETKWFQLNGCLFSYKEKPYSSLVFTDITDLKLREKRLKELLSLDLATGTTNKYGLMKAVRKIAKSRGSNDKYSLCMIDFDNFKLLNDQYGHLFGDKVLEKFSDIAHRHIRKDDLLGRYGGEEFVFVFNDINERQSFEILRRIQTELSGYFIKSSHVPVTFSAGIVTIDGSFPFSTYKQLLGEADSLLYEAKKLGRSRAMSRLGEAAFTETNE